jgi:TusA-related sulfurtransferase
VTDDIALTIDALGTLCPQPIIELARHIDGVAPGSVIAVLSDDPAAANDVAAWCRMRGHDYLGERPAAVGAAYLIRCRTSSAASAP